MVITATSVILLGLLGVATATATGYVANEYGDEFGKAIENGIEKAIQDSKEHSPMANMVKYATNVAKGDIGKTIGITSLFNNNKQDKEPEEEDKEKTPIPPIIPTQGTGTGTETEQGTQTPSISDESMTNVESMLNGNDLQQYLTKMRDEQWAREDRIRQETQEREDTAYQRAVKDMWRAGINPNLMNVSPAESGGGITNATGIDYSVYQGEIEKAVKEFEAAINNAFKEDENSKDRITDIVQSGMLLMGVLMGKGLMKK